MVKISGPQVQNQKTIIFPGGFWENSFKMYYFHVVYYNHHKIASSNTSHLEAHTGFFKLYMDGILGPYVLWPFDKKLIS